MLLRLSWQTDYFLLTGHEVGLSLQTRPWIALL